MAAIKYGFAPVFDGHSRVLILGSFPSVKSRQVEFYYGNRQNRFWRILCSFFGEGVPESVDEKKALLLRRNVALWDMVTECEIEGSSDASIKNYKVADLGKVMGACNIELIILNGGKAAQIFERRYSDIGIPHVALPSTSPANTRCDENKWYATLSSVFGAPNNARERN